MTTQEPQLPPVTPHSSPSDNHYRGDVFSQLILTKAILPSMISSLPPVSLAYLGDAVYELYIRTIYLTPPRKVAQYHHLVVEKVRAETQHSYLQSIYYLLNDTEKEWVKRGRNSVRKSPRGLPLQVYQQATGFETLLGYLYIVDQDRLSFLLSFVKE